jgi:hypothetical protein
MRGASESDSNSASGFGTRRRSRDAGFGIKHNRVRVCHVGPVTRGNSVSRFYADRAFPA